VAQRNRGEPVVECTRGQRAGLARTRDPAIRQCALLIRERRGDELLGVRAIRDRVCGQAKQRRPRFDVARIEAERFRELAARTDALAIVDGRDRFGYRALHRIAQRLRHALRARTGQPPHEIEDVGRVRQRAHERIGRGDQVVDLPHQRRLAEPARAARKPVVTVAIQRCAARELVDA
jgi:hypothetical protein